MIVPSDPMGGSGSRQKDKRERERKKKQRDKREIGRKAWHQEGFSFVKQEVWKTKGQKKSAISVCYFIKLLFSLHFG